MINQQALLKIFMIIALAVAALGATAPGAADWVGGSCSLEQTEATLMGCVQKELSVGDHISDVYRVLGKPVRIVTFTVTADDPKEFADGSSVPPGLYELHRFDFDGSAGHLLVTFRSSRVVTVDHFAAGSMRR